MDSGCENETTGSKPVYVLGISAFYHDSAACVLRDGVIVAAAQEERFTRRKHDASFPENAIAYCLTEAGITRGDIQYVAFYEKPRLKFSRILSTHLCYAPHGFHAFASALSVWLRYKFFIKNIIRKQLEYSGEIYFPEHHLSHAMSAYYPSPFDEAVILTIDGVGEWATTSIAVGTPDKLEIIKQLKFPHSLGLLYSAFTGFLGFKVNSGEYKVMGLAPYGRPVYADTIRRELIDIKQDGSFHLNMKHFSFPISVEMTNSKFEELFGKARIPESELTQREMDIAASLQQVLEEVVQKMVAHACQITGVGNLCMAGGVALNCVSNGKILESGVVDNIWIQPAAGDAGGAVGAALAIWHDLLGNMKLPSSEESVMCGSYLGPSYSSAAIKNYLSYDEIPYSELEDEELFDRVSDLLGDGKVIGWFQGRMEFGPRALGARSILGDPRSEKMQEIMNLKIKFRESFRPFAPSVLEEDCSEWFDLDSTSPYMLLVSDVNSSKKVTVEEDANLFGIEKLKLPRSQIPAVTHVDYSARVQTVSKGINPRYHQLISAFRDKFKVPLLINTSFNVRGEPPVCSPQDAFRCFMRTDMDYLVLENILIDKRDQNPLAEDSDWQKEFELD